MSAVPERYGSDAGSRDGQGAGDHDTPYEFGRKPSVDNPGLLTLRQLAALLRLRGRVQDDTASEDRAPRHALSIHGDRVWVEREQDLLQGRMEPN